jgi:hypothetical protein
VLRIASEVDRELQANHGTGRLSGHRFLLPNVEDCYLCANSCLDMWNESVDHAARSWLLQMAGAWMQLASQSDSHRRAERSQTHNVDPERLAAA